MSAPAIAVSRLSKRFQDLQAVDDLSLDVEPGEFFGFLGPNGAGKTTTINAIVGLVRFQQGSISIFGHDVGTAYRDARRLVGLAPQDYNFDRYLTIREVLIYQAGYYGISPGAVAARADALLRQFDLYGKRDVNFIKLSGGMKRRLTLARALIHEPRVLILDEPTAGVDVELRLALWDWLKELNRKGMTIFLTTHYLEEAEHLCQRIGIINGGKLIALDDTAHLVNTLRGESVGVTLERLPPELPRELAALNPEAEGNRLIFRDRPANQVYALLSIFNRLGLPITGVATEQSTLQDVFLKLTKPAGPLP